MSLQLPAAGLNGRVLLISAGTLVLLFLVFFGVRRTISPSFHFNGSDGPSQDKGLLEDIFNATLGFQKIFVVSLATRTDRRDSMSLAAAFSGLQVEYVDGVLLSDDDVEEFQKTLPPGGLEKGLKAPALGSWRAHLNAIKRVVERNLTSALILEDDTDWDLRIKSQMQDFAKASRMLVQPMRGTRDRFLDPSYPRPSNGQNPENFELGTSETSEPSTSPYGDVSQWDLLWLGHCGGRFPRPGDESTPLGRIVISHDDTVPEPQHINMQMGNDELIKQYPAHTRVVSRAHGNMCTLAYAISRPGSRRLLYELGIHKQDGAADTMIRHVCDGMNGRSMATCLTVQPQLFQHHRPVANKATFSDISNHGDVINEVAFTRNVRWSTRLNFPKLVAGDTDYIDLFKDGEEANPDLGFG